MSYVETEFEEDSFEDEFEPEVEREIERRCPKVKPMPMFRAPKQARDISNMLQRSLGLNQDREPIATVEDLDFDTPAASGGAAATNSSSTTRPAIGASASVRAEGYVSALLSPRSLKQLSASCVLKQKNKETIYKFNPPGYLFPVLFAEAARLRFEDAMIHLVATWRLPVLNLNDMDIPLESYIAREPPEKGPCIADYIIKGLLYRRRKYCQLQMLVLPKDTRIGSDVFGHFARIPYHYCSRLRSLRISQILATGRMKEGPKYIKEVPKIETKHEINFYAYMKGNLKVIIAVPVGVIHWVGRKANVADVHAGLILQKHSPFIFHFDDMALINFVDTDAIAVILDLIVNPEKVKKLMIKNKRVFRPDHISYILSHLNISLRRFTGLRGFFSKLSAMIGYGPEDNFQMKEDDPELIADVLRSWPQLTRLNYNDQPLEVRGSFPALFNPIVGWLTKLSLVRCKLTGDDLRIIAESRHVETVRILRLDYNDFKEFVDDVVNLLSRLKSVQILRMQACRIKYRNCMRCAEALSHSQTLRIWNFTDNVLFKVKHIKEFAEICSNIVSLRAVGCRPLDFHVLLGKVVLPSKKALSESKKRELDEFGDSLNLLIF